MTLLQKIIVQAAKTWIGTKFKYQGRIKQQSVDCFGLIMGIAKELELLSKNGQLLSHYDQLNYARIPDNKQLIKFFDKHFIRIDKNQYSYGDIVIFQFNGKAQHIALVSFEREEGAPTIIHSYAQVKKVVEQSFTGYWQDKICGVYRFAHCKRISRS